MDTPRDLVLDLAGQLKSGGVSIDDVLKEAGVDRSTWTRWKAGVMAPSLDNWLKVQAAAAKRLPMVEQGEAA